MPGGDSSENATPKPGFSSPLLIVALACTSAIALWGLFDATGLARNVAMLVNIWFSVFGGAAFHAVLGGDENLLTVVVEKVSPATFCMLPSLPLSTMAVLLVVIAAFLFIVTRVVSAAFVLGMPSTGGDLNPGDRVKLSWGVILGALGVARILSGNVDAINSTQSAGDTALRQGHAVAGRMPVGDTVQRGRGKEVNNLVDTRLTIHNFVFVGLLIRLYFKPITKDSDICGLTTPARNPWFAHPSCHHYREEHREFT